jgi:hypothetical protein
MLVMQPLWFEQNQVWKLPLVLVRTLVKLALSVVLFTEMFP